MPWLAILPFLGSIIGSGVSAFGANKAANTQADAANAAANVSRQNAVDALNFQKQVYGDQQRNIAPWLNQGSLAINQLGQLMGLGSRNQQPNWGSGGNTFSANQWGGGNGSMPLSNLGGGGAVPMSAQGSTVGNAGDLRSLINGGVNPNFGRPIPGGAVPYSARSATASMDGGAQVPMLNPASPTPMTGGAQVPMTGGGPSGIDFMGGGPGGAVNMSSGGDGSMVPRLDANGNPMAQPGGFGSLATPFGESFSAPTNVTEQNDPGFQFRLQQGQQALERSAAARGGLLSGGTAKAINDYAQNSASNEYGNVYNRALGEYQQRYNIYNQDQNTLFNRLASLSGMGQTSAGQLNSAGSNAAGNVGDILGRSAAQQGYDLNAAGAARGTGYQNVSNSIGNGIGSLAILAQLLGGGGSGFPGGDPSICWIAEELYGVDDPRTHTVRTWLNNVYRFDTVGQHFVSWYEKHGKDTAEMVKCVPGFRAAIKPLFDSFIFQASRSEPQENYESVKYQR